MSIPFEWSETALQDIAVLARGKFSARPRNDPKFFGGEFPFVQTGDVRNARVELRDYSQTLNDAGLRVSKLFPKGTLLFTIAANIGEVAFLGFDGACPDSLVAITPREGISERWLFYQLGFMQSHFEAAATQNAQLNINLEKLNPFKIPVPPLTEQQAIAEVLSDADALIEGLERLIAKKRLIKQGAMQDLLTARRRLPGFSGEWEQTKLRSLLKSAPSYGINSAACPLGSGGYDYLRITDIDEHGRLRQEGRAEVLHPAATRYFLEPDDIVVARTGASTGKSYRYDGPNSRTVFAGFLIKLTPTPDSVVPSFLFQIMQTDVYWSWIAENSARSGQPGINGQQLSGMSVVIPTTVAEQQAIASILDDMDAEIQALETRLAKARQVKEGMMQNLLTGRIRLI